MTPDTTFRHELDHLERALAEGRLDRAELHAALSAIEAILRDHAAAMDGPGGLLDEEGRSARPSLERQVGKLRREVSALLRQADALHQQAEGSASKTVRRKSAALLAAVRQLRADEADVALESANTDIGAGD